MPFKSEKQRKWMYANDPEMAAEWEEHTPKGKRLPEYAPKKKKSKADYKAEIIRRAVLSRSTKK